MVTEITEHKQNEEKLSLQAQKLIERDKALQESEDKFRLILENSSDSITLLDCNTGRYIYISPSMEQTSGYSAEELSNLTFENNLELVHPDDRHIILDITKMIFEQDECHFQMEYRWRIKSGAYRWVRQRCKLTRDSNGNPLYIVGITRDITEVKKIQDENKKQQEKLLAMEKAKVAELNQIIAMKDEFLSIISHEMRTPITVVSTALQAINAFSKDEFSQKTKKYLNIIMQNTNRQLKLINNILDITRIDSGYYKVNSINADIVALTKNITESIKPYADNKGIILNFASTIKEKVIGIDDIKYERILLNLLSNAIKFTPKGKTIDVKVFRRLTYDNYRICIQVKDTGIGIPKDKQESIFERFGQVNNSLTRQAEGTGIGLSLVKKLVVLLNGELTLKSKVGEGSTFIITLPVEKVEQLPDNITVENTNNRLIQAMNIEFSDVYI